MGGGVEDACRDRQRVEISLLQAMYPEQLDWDESRKELKYTGNSGALLVLRLPENYPINASPMLISAVNTNKRDLRDLTKSEITTLNLALDEEVLDTIIQAFENLVNDADQADSTSKDTLNRLPIETASGHKISKTVVIWLHHLLNTNKRKLATAPNSHSTGIIGFAKPGYPGIIIYSGNEQEVTDQVAELKKQRWQAFQIRLEETSTEPWNFTHGSGVREVETMSELSQGIVDQSNREAFLKAVHIK